MQEKLLIPQKKVSLLRKKIFIFFIFTLFTLLLFLFYDLNYQAFEYIFRKRIIKLWSMILVAVAISLSTLTFQAITNNRILTPAILGLDSLYNLFQLLIVVVFGPFSVLAINHYLNFTISSVLMVSVSFFLFKYIFSKSKSVFLILLIGIVMGTFFDSINGMLQIIISPDVFTMIIDRLFANFNNLNTDILLLSTFLIFIILFILIRQRKVLDVLSLGKDSSINLGVNYYQEISWLLILTFLLVSIATALVGPITFLGFFAVNIAKSLLKDYRHDYLMIATSLVAITVLVLGQFVIEHIYEFGLPISVIISLIGGGYFVFMLLKENRDD